VCQVGGAEVNRSLQITRTNDAVTGIDTYCPTQGQQTLNAAAEAAFADTHIVVPEPGVQPGTSTLVNWPTTVYSTFTTYDTPTNLAGTPVKFRIMPTTYHWNFGDGTTMDSTWGGEQLDIDSLYRSVDWDMDAMQELLKDRAPAYREYTSCAHRTVQLSVTVGGQYSVNGGPYTTIAGTLTADAPPLVLNVREARSELVAPGAPPPSPRTCRHTGD
jgi:hypothetical protein